MREKENFCCIGWQRPRRLPSPRTPPPPPWEASSVLPTDSRCRSVQATERNRMVAKPQLRGSEWNAIYHQHGQDLRTSLVLLNTHNFSPKAFTISCWGVLFKLFDWKYNVVHNQFCCCWICYMHQLFKRQMYMVCIEAKWHGGALSYFTWKFHRLPKKWLFSMLQAS